MVYMNNGIFFSLEREEILTLEDMMLSEKGQSQKYKSCMTPLS